MASTKEYCDFILEQLSEAPNITCRPMMGEFLLYSNNVLFGGIYDDRLLIKIVPKNKQYIMSESIPYDGAKPYFYIEDVDDRDYLSALVKATCAELPEPKPKNKKK